jgi:integrase
MAATAVALKTKSTRERGTGRVWLRGEIPWIRYYSFGKQRSESCAEYIENFRRVHSKSARTNLEIAEELLAKRIGARLNDILPPPQKSRVTVAELYEDKLANLKQGSPKSADWMKSRWELRLRDYFGARRAREIRLADLTAYQTKRMEFYREQFPEASPKKLSACETNVNGDLSALRMMFSLGKQLEKIDIIPTFPKMFDGAMEREGTVTREQFDAMVAACQEDELWLKTFLMMAHTWGYRLRELLNLQCARVNLRDKTVYLPPRTTKNKQPRTVPISDREIPLLEACIAGKLPQDFVFTRRDGTHVRDIRHPWDRIVETAKAGHAEISLTGKEAWYPAIPHDLRRTAISQMLNGGMPPEAVRSIVGHLSPEMTKKYYRPAVDMLRRLQHAAELQVAFLSRPEEVSEDHRLPQNCPRTVPVLAAK